MVQAALIFPVSLRTITPLCGARCPTANPKTKQREYGHGHLRFAKFHCSCTTLVTQSNWLILQCLSSHRISFEGGSGGELCIRLQQCRDPAPLPICADSVCTRRASLDPIEPAGQATRDWAVMRSECSAYFCILHFCYLGFVVTLSFCRKILPKSGEMVCAVFGTLIVTRGGEISA